MTRVALAVVLTVLVVACNRPAGPASAPAPSANAWAVVNGREISRDEVEKAYRRAAPDNTQPQPSEEEAYTAKLNLLNELIVQDILLAKAKELKIELPESELDNAYNEAKKNIPPAAYEEELKKRNITAADMREDLRRSLLAQKVVDKEVGEKATPSDAEITAFFEANKAQFNRTEDAVRIAQIVITPVREPQATNRTGDDATSAPAATAKAQMIMQRLKEGVPFGDLAADYSEDDGGSAQRGGDLGFVPISALAQAPPPLRDAVMQGQPGNVRLVSAGGAHTIVLVVAKDKKGQKDLSMPEVKEGISSMLKTRKEQLLRAAYLSALRNDAVVYNVLAKQIVDAGGKVPASAAAPAAAATPAPAKKN
ncbi:MAG TPA: SurA N-terminal domain-containing protein [Vicinamibacterales bacterium]